MDRHFAETPPARNLPLLLGLLDVWYRDFRGCTTRCIAPYHHGLRRLPAYLQQLEMESNGKRVDEDGEPVSYATSPVVWGEAGTNAQHAYFQMLHQGTDVIPVEFILVRRPTFGLAAVEPAFEAQLERQHRMLLANGLAQAQALMAGKSAAAARDEKVPTASPSIDADTLARHRTFPGNRPSTTLLLEQLTPRSLGALIALYEHRVFVEGALFDINSFDQWGVELGKELATELLPVVEGKASTAGKDSSTAGLVAKIAELREAR
jgi:glucose-6-phosphate isomerase